MSGVEREPVTIARSRQTVEGMLEGLPKKTGEIRKKHVVVKDSCEIEQKIEANDRSIAGILTNRGCAYAGAKGSGLRADQRHPAHHPRPHRLRLLHLGDAPQSDEPGRGQGLLLGLLPEHRRQGDRHRLRSGEEAGPGHPGGLLHLQAGMHLGLLHLPHRPHRRRYRIGLPQSRGGPADQGDTCALRRLPGRLSICRPPHRLQLADGAPGGHRGPGEPGTLRRQRLRRVQHRRRLLGGQRPAGEGGLPHRQPLHRRRLVPRYRQSPQGQAEHPALPPLHQLHQPHDGGEVRHSLAEGQLPGRGGYRQNVTRYGRVLRRPGPHQENRSHNRRGDGQNPAGNRHVPEEAGRERGS